MTRNQKLLIGLAGAGVLAYLLFKGSKAKAQTTPTGTTDVKSKKCEARLGEFGVECNDGSCDVSNGIAMPCRGKAGGVKGSTLENSRVMCPKGQMPCPDDGGCFDPNVTYIRNPCDRSTFPAFKNIKPVFDNPQGPVPFGAEPMAQI